MLFGVGGGWGLVFLVFFLVHSSLFLGVLFSVLCFICLLFGFSLRRWGGGGWHYLFMFGCVFLVSS